MPRAAMGKQMKQQGARQSPSTGVAQNYASIEVMPRQKQRDSLLFINTPESTRLLWKVLLFHNFTHSVTDHAHKTFPFANPQPPGLGEMGHHHLFTSHCEYPRAKSEGPDGSSPGGRIQPLVSILTFKHRITEPSDLKD